MLQLCAFEYLDGVTSPGRGNPVAPHAPACNWMPCWSCRHHADSTRLGCIWGTSGACLGCIWVTSLLREPLCDRATVKASIASVLQLVARRMVKRGSPESEEHKEQRTPEQSLNQGQQHLKAHLGVSEVTSPTVSAAAATSQLAQCFHQLCFMDHGACCSSLRRRTGLF